MKNTGEIGRKGELIAETCLQQKGYQTLEKNYRHKRGEIDLIMLKNETLIFVEVKYRSSNSFGNPEDFVDSKKISLIKQTAEHYIFSKQWQGMIRFDIIALIGDEKIEHFEDAFG